MIIKIGKRLINKCKKFAVKRITGSSDLYSYRGESRTEKMVEDVLIGTIGEWAVKEHLESLGHHPTDPDMKIYEKRRKSFDADLYVDDFKVHVKSQGTVSAKRYGYSWLMQRHDKIVSKPSDDDLFAFTNVNLEDQTVEILGYCWAEDMKYGECKVPRYRNTKVAIYFEQIEDQLAEI